MGNINNYNFNRFDLKLSKSDNWDIKISSDGYNTCYVYSCEPVVWFNFDDAATYKNSAFTSTTLYSLVTWTGATNTGYTFNTIGLTGLDNGLITLEKLSADTTNNILMSAITASTLVISSGDTRFTVNQVTGMTGNYIYPIDIVTGGTVGAYASLCGGFYQGYYKIDGYTYQVLPTRVNEGWGAEFWLNKTISGCTTSGQTLNDTYPENKGFFFYMGTRAENKYWNIWEGQNTGCTSGCTVSSGCTGTVTTWCTTVKENEVSILGDYGINIPLDPPQVIIDLVTNPFLIYGRGHGVLGSQTACSYDGNGVIVTGYSETITNTQNPFLIYGRASKNKCRCSSCRGESDGLGNETVCTFSGFTSPITELDYKIDIIDNAIGFRIKDDGSIGYRLLTVTAQTLTISGEQKCITGTSITEKYSASGAVTDDKWSYIVVKYKTDYLDDCQLVNHKERKGKLQFYVDGKLKLEVNDFPEFIARRLNEYKDKQIGVPFNFSIGGGSQGLLESQTFDGQDINDLGLPIETNFAGSFIGYIADFKFSVCDLNFNQIQLNYKNGLSKFL